MRYTTLVSILAFYLFAFAVAAHAQEVIGYAVVDYDGATNMLDGYAYTQPTYDVATYYDTEVWAVIQNDAGYWFASGGNVNRNGGWADIELIGPGDGCEYYTINVNHKTDTRYEVYEWYVPGQGYSDGYYDAYSFSDLENSLENNDNWDDSDFFGPGSMKIRPWSLSDVIAIGMTSAVTEANCGSLGPEVTLYKGTTKIGDNRHHHPTAVTVSAGDPINLSATVSGSGTLSNPIWTVPGSKVASYVITPAPPIAKTQHATTAVKTAFDDNSLHATYVNYYWADSEEGRNISYDVMINGVRVSDTYGGPVAAKFNVRLPFISLVANASSIAKLGAYGHDGLPFFGVHLGDPEDTGANDPGMDFDAAGSVPSGISGHWYFVQVIKSWDSHLVDNNNVDAHYVAANALDTTFPYDGGADATKTGDGPSNGTDDRCDDSSLSVSGTFDMYVLWKSSAANSIYTPVKKIPWSFSGSATRTSGTPTCAWSAGALSPSSLIHIDGVSAIGDHPQWSSNITNTFDN